MAQNQEYIDYYRTMVTIRQFETAAGQLYAAGKIPGFIHLSIGQEASAVGVCSCLRDDDYLTTTHRGHGHMIAKGADLNKMAAELFGKKTGYCKGKGGSMHIADFSLGILGANGVVAGGLSIIAGAGFSIKMRKTDQAAVCFFGDGASNRGPVHKVMNLAAVWKLPIIFVVENNQYASTTPQLDACSVEDICSRAAGYDMPGISVDGNDVLRVRQAPWQAAVKRPGRDVTLICYGSGFYLCQAAAEELNDMAIDAEIVDLRTLKPLDMPTVAASIKKSGRAIIVHEACLTGGFGAEMAARIHEELFDYLKAPVRRVAAKDVPVPFSPVLEDYVLPKVSDVVAAAREVVHRSA